MDHRKAVSRDHFGLQPEERQLPGISRPVSQAESLLRTYREERVRRERALLLCGLAVLILSASFMALLASKLLPSQPLRPTPVGALANNPGSLAAAQAAPLAPMPAGQTKILLLGSDQRPDDPGYRTDTIILLTLDPQNSSTTRAGWTWL